MEKKIRSILTALGLKLGTADDFLGNYFNLREYWIKRASAVMVDYFVILVATGLIFSGSHFLEFVFVSGILSLFYFSVMETRFGYTLGKKVFSLKVVDSLKLKPTLKTSLIRNISKINIIILLADTLFGLTSNRNQKYIDAIAKATVVETMISQPKPLSKVIYYEETTKIS